MSVFTRRTRTVSFRLSEKEYKELRDTCIAHGIRSISDLARLTTQWWIDADGGPNEPLLATIRELRGKLRELDSEVKRLAGECPAPTRRTPARKSTRVGREVMMTISRILLLAFVMAPAPSPAAAESVAPPVSGYVLGPDDQTLIRALETGDMFEKPVLIGTNGNVTLPLIGRVQAAGLTVEQLETELSARLKKYVLEPQLSVTVVEFRSHPVSVFGAVTTPASSSSAARRRCMRSSRWPADPARRRGQRYHHRPAPELAGSAARRRNRPTGRFSTAEVSLQEIVEGKNPGANIEIKSSAPTQL